MLLICITIVICCVLFTLIPHMHECNDTYCSVCDIIDTMKKMLRFISFVTVLLLFISWLTSFLIVDNSYHSTKENTPVGRKVKLSD